MPYYPPSSFPSAVVGRATIAAATIGGTLSDVTWGTVTVDTNNRFNASSNATTYTIPVTGYYNFSGQIFVGGTDAVNSTLTISLVLSTSTMLASFQFTGQGISTGYSTRSFNFQSLSLTSGDVIKVQISAGGWSPLTANNAGYSFLQIQQIH